jgi:hypothetical protein
MHQLSHEIQDCIRECLNCYEVCRREAMNHCLEAGGRHTQPSHFRLMLSCAEICRTAVDFMLSSSPVHAQVCAACAEVCAACLNSCEQVGGMDECVQACRRCEESCRSMAKGHGFATGGFSGSQSQTSTSPVKAPM